MSVISAIATGLTQGVKEYGDNERRMKADERDEQRFAWEKGDQDEKSRMRDELKAVGEKTAQWRSQFANGKLPGAEITDEAKQTGELADASYDRAENAKFARQQAIATGQPEPQAPAAQPATTQAIGTPAQPTPPPAETKSLSMTQRQMDIFKSNGEGLYKNQKQANDMYWDGLKDIYGQFYEKTGQLDKRMELDKKIDEWKNSAVDELRKAASAAVVSGDPGAMDMVSKFAQKAGLGLNYQGGNYDQQSHMWKGVTVTGPDGKTVTKDIPANNIFAALGTLSPERLVQMDVENGFKSREIGARERTSEAQVLSAKAHAASAADNAATNKTTRAANAAVTERAQVIKEDESAARHFGTAFGVKEFEVKPKDEIDALMPAQKKAYEEARAENSKRRETATYAQGLYSLNDRKVPPAAITAAIPVLQRRISEGKGADGMDATTGLPYVTINGKKILLPKD